MEMCFNMDTKLLLLIQKAAIKKIDRESWKVVEMGGSGFAVALCKVLHDFVVL